MMKRLAWICSLVALFSLSVVDVSRTEPYQHPETGIIFPDQLAGMDKGKITNYEKEHPGLGVSIGYYAPGITFTIYLYDMGMKTVPSDLESPVFRKHFEQVAGDVIRAGESGLYSNVVKLSEETIFLRPSQEGRRALSASFTFTLNGRDRISYLYLMAHKNYFLKVRFTYEKSIQTAAESTLKQFLQDLSDMIEEKPASDK
jgi:hypothetical protein